MRFSFFAPMRGNMGRTEFAEVGTLEADRATYRQEIEDRFRELSAEYESLVVTSDGIGEPFVVAAERVPVHSVQVYERRREPFRKLFWVWPDVPQNAEAATNLSYKDS